MIEGAVDPRFQALSDAFSANFSPSDGDPGELGAALAVIIDGRVVVDLWGGWCDLQRRRSWQRDTLVNLYSIGKAVTATVALALVERGELSLDHPLVNVWPEFGAGGKHDITLRQVLAHRAGLPAVRQRLVDDDMYRWETMTAALAATPPWWEPNTAHGYHTNTLGFLVGEPVRRALDCRFGDAVAELVTGPAGADLFVGVPASEHHRISTVDIPDNPFTDLNMAFDGEDDLDLMRMATYFNPPGFSGFGTVNTTPWRSSEIPSTNPHGTALSVAKVFAGLVGTDLDQTPALLDPSILAEATSEHSMGLDLVLGRTSRFGLGFMLSQPDRPIGVGPASFGHFGYGGSLGFADPDARIGFGYVMNRPGDRWQVPRTRRLLAALTECLS